MAWTLDYWKLFKKPQLILPADAKKSKVDSLRAITFLVGLVGLLLISFAMTGPRKALKTVPGNIEVNDVFLVVDVSRSMLADDLKPNRLEVAKTEAQRVCGTKTN